MSSHHDWVIEQAQRHDAEKPFAPENGKPLMFKEGDAVIFTNDNGVSFPLKVTGLYRPESPCGQYSNGARYFLDWDCHWFPVAESALCLAPVGF